MPRENTALVKFNAGKLSTQGLARVDLDRTRFSAETQTNYIPKTLGPMMLRPGLGYIGSTYQHNKAFHIPYIAAIDDTALIELTALSMRVRINDTVVSRVSVSTAFTNGTFNSDLTGWTDADQSGATSQWVTGGYMGLTGTAFNKAIRKQTLTIAGADQNKEHGIRITITRGAARIRVGSTDGDDDYVQATELLPGTHSIAFTPTGGSAYVELASYTKYQTLIDSIAIEASGDMVLPTIWPEASLFSLRHAQSIDVIFCACYGYKPQRIERHGVRSWSVVDYVTEDGPYMVQNTGATTLAASAISGDITLTASQSLFKSTNVGGLFSIVSAGQTVTSTLTGEGQYTNFIRVVGTGSSRTFSVTISGTWAGTITLQRSFTDDSSPANTTTTYTTNQTNLNVSDGLDNEIVYYRLGFNTGQYTSGSATATLSYSSGGLTGVVRITAYSSPTSATASVLTDLGGTAATSNWSEGLWSDRRGYPSATALYEGRLWWAGKGTIVGSVSDAYNSFDPDTEGDSGPINRTIGEGPIDKINYILPLQRLMLGGQGSEFSIRSSAFDEIITPDNFNIKSVSTQGSDNIAAVKMDNSGIFAQQGATRVFEFVYNSDIFDYEVQELTTLVPEQCQATITKMIIQRKPDTRIHCILEDGTVGLLTYNKAEQVNGWVDIVSDGADGLIEDAVVLPGGVEDTVYYVVKRTIDGSTVRYLEKWALESECVGEDLNKQVDSFIVYNSTSTTTITGLSTLEGEEVEVWADGMDVGPLTVSSGQITLSTAASKVVVGLYYRARFKSVKLAYAAEGTALTMHKRVPQVGLILNNTHRYGVKYGGDFDHLQSLPAEYQGKFLGDNEIIAAYDDEQMSLNGDWDTDSRICLQSESPKPAFIIGLTFTVETNG